MFCLYFLIYSQFCKVAFRDTFLLIVYFLLCTQNAFSLLPIILVVISFLLFLQLLCLCITCSLYMEKFVVDLFVDHFVSITFILTEFVASVV